MKGIFIVICSLVFPFVVSAQLHPNLIKFWELMGQGYEHNNMEKLLDFHGPDYEKVILKNPLPDVDVRDRAWKIVYPGGEFYFYKVHNATYRTGSSFLFHWSITPSFKLPDDYKFLFEINIYQIRRFFGIENYWLKEPIAGYAVPKGAIYFTYNDKKNLVKISWSSDFP